MDILFLFYISNKVPPLHKICHCPITKCSSLGSLTIGPWAKAKDFLPRNEKLAAKGFPMPRARKTGTTIAGIVFKDGVVLGADTRATEGDTVADKNCSKIHYLQPNMYCCGAGEEDCETAQSVLLL